MTGDKANFTNQSVHQRKRSQNPPYGQTARHDELWGSLVAKMAEWEEPCSEGAE
jgi:hypothetical protein